jgi:hypothetical protein
MTELRDYQVEAVEKLETAINLGNARSTYCPLPAESRANLLGQDAHNGTDGEVRR